MKIGGVFSFYYSAIKLFLFLDTHIMGWCRPRKFLKLVRQVGHTAVLQVIGDLCKA